MINTGVLDINNEVNLNLKIKILIIYFYQIIDIF